MAGFSLWYNSHKHAPDWDSSLGRVQPRGSLQLMGPWPWRIFVVSSLAPGHVVKPSNFGSRPGYWWLVFTNRIPPLNPSYILQLLLIGFMLPIIFILRIILIQCCTGLMMCSIHIDESAIHVSIASRCSRLYVPYSKKLDSLLERLNNQRMMHDFQCGVHKWVHRNRNDTHYYSTAMLNGL
jgi:hypothetical protein